MCVCVMLAQRFEVAAAVFIFSRTFVRLCFFLFRVFFHVFLFFFRPVALRMSSGHFFIFNPRPIIA